MKNNKLSVALVALTGLAALAGGAKANTSSNGDLILGVYDPTGNVSNSYEVDLGSITKFINTKTPISFTLTSDLNSVFTSKGTALSSLEYAVDGSTSIQTTVGTATFPTNKTIFTTNAETTAGVHQALIESNNLNANPNTNITSMEGTFNAATTPNGFTADSAIIANSATGSFDTREHDNNGNFGYANNAPAGVLNKFDTGTSTYVSDLDQIPNAADSSLLGTFTFSTLGGQDTLIFDPNLPLNVPEPSTYALMLCGGAFLLWVLKRRQTQA